MSKAHRLSTEHPGHRLLQISRLAQNRVAALRHPSLLNSEVLGLARCAAELLAQMTMPYEAKFLSANTTCLHQSSAFSFLYDASVAVSVCTK